MICPPCAEKADQPSDAGRGHMPEVCQDHGREIKACGCQHGQPRQAGERT